MLGHCWWHRCSHGWQIADANRLRDATTSEALLLDHVADMERALRRTGAKAKGRGATAKRFHDTWADAFERYYDLSLAVYRFPDAEDGQKARGELIDAVLTTDPIVNLIAGIANEPTAEQERATESEL